jgi:hypothetical protein
MKTVILSLALLAALTGLADTAQATCYVHHHEIDPVKKETGTVVDAVAVSYDHIHCEGPPPE